MKRTHWLFIVVLTVGLAAAVAQEDEDDSDQPPPNTHAEAGGVTIAPTHGEISPNLDLTITFPRAMVPADRIDVGNQPCPFNAEPKLEGTFLWKSQTEGVFSVTGVIAGAHYQLTLAPDLKDITGEPIKAPGWSAEFQAPEFSVTSDFEERQHLNARPQIVLDTNYAVRLTDAVDHIYFQDRDSRERFPIEVIVPTSEETSKDGTAEEWRVTPRAPLPVGHTYDLVIDGLVEAKNQRPLGYPRVFRAGKTEPLKIEWLGAFNLPLDQATIRIKLNDDIDPEEATPERVRIEPAVPEMKLLASGDEIDVQGEFDVRQRYRVTISPELKGERGYGLAAESHWSATFHPVDAAIIFPSSQVFMRSRQELRFAFIQIDTPAVTWKLARIPLEKLAAVKNRVREFEKDEIDPLTGKPVVDPKTGAKKPLQTELLADAFELPVTASGNFDASANDEHAQREIRWSTPDGETLSGPYLLEASTRLPDGRIVGNRSIVCISDFLLTQKRTPASVLLRVAKMSDGQPVSGVLVRALSDENIELARETSDANGCATFLRDAILPEKTPKAELFIADTANGPALQFVSGAAFPSGEPRTLPARKPHAEIITDRNLYRPGQIVKMKGIVRAVHGNELALPNESDVHWRVSASEGHLAAEGRAVVSTTGGWEAEWNVPENVKLGAYEVSCAIGAENYDGKTTISVEEYRVPLFSVMVETQAEVGAEAHARVSSEYFHGAPNVGARVHWKATWTATAETGDNDYAKRYNSYKELGPFIDVMNESTKTIEGDAKLDAHGFVTLTCVSPYKDDPAVGRANVSWRAEVTSPDGQTITGGESDWLSASATRLGVKVTEQTTQPAGVHAAISSVNLDNEPVKGTAFRADLYHVVTKTAKEQIAPFVYRFRNTDEFTKVATQDGITPAELTFSTSETGRYVVGVSATSMKAPLVSDETTVTGEAPAELPVENETSLNIQHADRSFVPGEKAALTVQAPFGGLAWVSVETNEILDTLLVPLAGNASRIELPIKKEYAPNAAVSVYLVKPGGEKDLPRERFSFTHISVRRPDHELKVEPHFASKNVRPGDTVRGEVRVSSEDKPVAGADLAVFAVDDAVLKLGEWKLPDMLARFYKPNPFSVRTYEAVNNYVEQITQRSLTQKGFTIGDGGEDNVGNVTNVRKEFRTLAFWNGSLKTDAEGKAAFDFVAPDNLTSYRLVAIGQTRAHQFGGDASETVTISKPLLIDAALPRFLRDGDEVELRAVVRQKVADSQEIVARCVTDESCTLVAADSATQTAARDAPVVFRFRAKVSDRELKPAKIRFEAAAKSDANSNDAVEITLPVVPPTIVRKESVAGEFNATQFDARKAMPEVWKTARGQFSATLSTSPWLPKLAGLPFILEYPHGCFEQISTRLLGYSLLPSLLAYLPNSQARDAEYRRVLERGMKQFNDSLLDDGMLPYWPGGTTGHAFVTVQAFWSVNEAARAGFEAPDGLTSKMSDAVKRIINGQTAAGDLEKCFALFVLTQFENGGDFGAVSQELYLRRNRSSDEGRALLAIALHRQNVMPRETEQLLREINAPVKERAFDRATFTSTTRAEAMIALAFYTVAPKNGGAQIQDRLRNRMLQLMDSSASLSTQENLWLLVAFRSMLANDNAPLLAAVKPDGIMSKNGRSAAWIDRELSDDLIVQGLNKTALTFFLESQFSTEQLDTDRLDRGFRLERVVRDLSDSKRNGTNDAPFKIGDQLLITYRVSTAKLQNYVALEDDLPAGLETVNPNLAMVAKFFDLPPGDPHDRVLSLSHSELRDKATMLYFDEFEPGAGTYSVLARATAAGVFRWPATQIAPMYDSRFSGLSPSNVCVVSAE